MAVGLGMGSALIWGWLVGGLGCGRTWSCVGSGLGWDGLRAMLDFIAWDWGGVGADIRWVCDGIWIGDGV